MRALIITNNERTRVKRIVEYAKQPEHWYRVGRADGVVDPTPGDNPSYTCHLPFWFRCVFSFTHDVSADKLYRHLSVSVPSRGRLPNVTQVGIIADLFEFSGWINAYHWPADWICDVGNDTPCIVVMQRLAT